MNIYNLSPGFLLLFVCLLFSKIALAQNQPVQPSPQQQDSITALRKADSVLQKSQASIDAQHTTEQNKLDTLQAEIKNAFRLFEVATQKKTAAKSELDALRNKIDTLNKIAEEYSKRKDELASDAAQKQKSLDSINAVITSVEDKKAKLDSDLNKTNAEIEAANDELSIRKAELSKVEDSLEVIAKIELAPKSYIEFDLKRAKAELVNINRKTSPDEQREARAEVLKALDSTGFKCYRSTLLDSIINTGQFLDSLCKPCRTNAKVYEVNIDVNEGIIRELIVKTSWGVFRNLQSPIDLVHIGRRLDDRLYRDGENVYKHEYIKISRIIKYTPTRSFNDLPYTQFNITLFRDSSHKNESYWIRESTSINSYFDVALFTDLKGISGDANGLAQLTGSARFITNTANIKGSAWILFNYVAFNGNIAKFDNEFKGTLLLPGDSINRKDLLQRAKYTLGIKANLIHGVLSPLPKRLIQDMQLNAGYSFIGSQVLIIKPKDPSAPAIMDSSYHTVTHNQLFIEPLVSFTRYRNFNMALSLPFYFINLKESSGISNHGWEPWVKPSIELMYYAKRTSSSKIFFRYCHWINLKTKVDAFTQFQMGYSANLTELFQSH
jgi:hypothetical protein